MNQERRALFLFPTDRMGGAERITRTMVREAARSGRFDAIDCFILCKSRSGTLDSLLQLGNVALHYTEASNERGGLVALLRTLPKTRYDLVFSSHTHLNAVASGMRWAGLLRTRALVARESTMIFERKFEGVGRFFRFLYCFYGRQDMIICQTERMRQSLDRNTNHRFRDRLIVVPNPVDTERIDEGRAAPLPQVVRAIPEGRMLIGWCGRLSNVKSPLRALDVLREVRDRGADSAHLLFVGEGPMRMELEGRARELNIDQFVTFAGHMANPAPALMRCRLGLLTSDIEGFPNVILEMLACGIEGIATTDCAGGLDSIPSLHIAEAFTANALADALERAYACGRNTSVSGFLESRSPSAYLNKIMAGS